MGSSRAQERTRITRFPQSRGTEGKGYRRRSETAVWTGPGEAQTLRQFKGSFLRVQPFELRRAIRFSRSAKASSVPKLRSARSPQHSETNLNGTKVDEEGVCHSMLAWVWVSVPLYSIVSLRESTAKCQHGGGHPNLNSYTSNFRLLAQFSRCFRCLGVPPLHGGTTQKRSYVVKMYEVMSTSRGVYRPVEPGAVGESGESGKIGKKSEDFHPPITSAPVREVELSFLRATANDACACVL